MRDCDEKGGCRGISDGSSDDNVVLSANEHKRAGISHGVSARCGGFWDDKRWLVSLVRAFSFLACWYMLIFPCVVCVDANASYILNWSGIKQAYCSLPKDCETDFFCLHLTRIYLSDCLIYRIMLSRHPCTKHNP